MDGRPQRSCISKEESASPTCSNETLMLVLIQAAHEGRKIHTADVRGAYLHTEMNDFVVIKLQGQIMDILCDMNPEYKNCGLREWQGNSVHAADEGPVWMYQICTAVVQAFYRRTEVAELNNLPEVKTPQSSNKEMLSIRPC